jgi:Spx/MgsR family transcriptional regulator
MTNSSTPTITVYGIPNCDSVKKARTWLEQHGLTHAFHDFRKLGVPAEPLQQWLAQAGWERVLNRKGTTWRKLDTGVQTAVVDGASAAALMQQQPSVIKRPVIDWGAGRLTVGYTPDEWPPGA